MKRSISINFKKMENFLLQEGLQDQDEKITYLSICVEDKNKSGKVYIDTLDISVGLYNILQSIGLVSIDRIVKYSSSDLLRFRRFGPKKLEELIIVLKEHGQSLRPD